MRQLILLSLLCNASLKSMDALWIDEEDHVTISPFTELVEQRYYLIARLEPIHHLIEKLNCTCVITLEDFTHLSHIEPTHHKIIYCIGALQQDLTCEPLLTLWQEVTAYKYLTDAQFEKEYSTLVTLVAHQLVSLMHDRLSPHEKKMLGLLEKRSEQAHTTADITFRYYLLKRLKRVTALLVHCKNIETTWTIMPYLSSLHQSSIVRCAKAIECEQSLDPLLAILSSIEQYQEIDNIAFIYELLQLILIIEQRVLAPQFLPRKRELCAHYEHTIDGLSIEEMLKSIDILTAHIEPYAQHTTDFAPRAISLTTFAAAYVCAYVLWLCLS